MKQHIKLLTIFITVMILVGCAKSAYNKANEANTIIGYKQFISKYPDSEFTEQAKIKAEKLFWQKKQARNTIISYTSYLALYPQGIYASEARKILHEHYWKNAVKNNDIKSYEKYLDKYPKGKYLKIAKSEIEELSWRNAENNKLYRKYLNKYPQGKYVIQASNYINSLIKDSGLTLEQQTKLNNAKDYLIAAGYDNEASLSKGDARIIQEAIGSTNNNKMVLQQAGKKMFIQNKSSGSSNERMAINHGRNVSSKDIWIRLSFFGVSSNEADSIRVFPYANDIRAECDTSFGKYILPVTTMVWVPDSRTKSE